MRVRERGLQGLGFVNGKRQFSKSVELDLFKNGPFGVDGHGGLSDSGVLSRVKKKKVPGQKQAFVFETPNTESSKLTWFQFRP